MKKALLIIASFALSLGCLAQNAPAAKPVYDAALAKKLGADDYSMKKYVLAFLKEGPTQLKDSAANMQLQMAHLKNIGRLAAEGKLVVAGPFLDNQPLRGIFIFNVETIEEAQKLTETDPAIKAGALVMELHPFYCSAALMQVVPIHNTLQKKSMTN
ncbi:YciI family protein [Mucilaginibacter sp. cycad4]|uniref:YciI family protein n=1 Tax=Mucilaginibacter sp. cycad4 TaxID=3342096 RepID=UPI002AAB65A4|nr:YciI family protein [Mucilaginibacter gossypii]WPU97660.1 YciI family protein [Mucilaginibacter gossypii]